MVAAKDAKKQKSVASLGKKKTHQNNVAGAWQPEHLPGSSYSQQRYLGNDYVQAMAEERREVEQEASPASVAIQERMGGKIQTKLIVNQPGDKYEQEADQVAEAVMQMPEVAVLQHLEGKEDSLQTKPLSSQITPLVQPRQAASQPPSVTPELESRVHALKDSGQPLPESVRAYFEPRFGHDLGQVRVHTNSQAAETVRAVGAQAFTVGCDVFFGERQYALGTWQGKRLLVHELAHVLQQTGQTQPGTHVSNQRGYFAVQRANLDREVEKKIAELPTESRETLLSVANMANDLVDSWHTGALDAVKDFAPKVLVETEFDLALGGNLLWAASVLTKNPWLYIPMAFTGAYISGTATEDYGFDEAVKASREGYASRMHNLRNKLESEMDKILYNPLTSYGFEAFLKLSLKEKRRLAWSWIFKIDWNNGEVIETSKEAALHNLQKCDRRTELFLKHLHRCWTKSFTSYGADPLGQHYWLLDEDEWYKQTSFPLEEYAGMSAPGINMQRIRNKNLPPRPISLDFVNRRNTKIFISFVAKLPKPA